jgi:hypothetical protein
VGGGGHPDLGQQAGKQGLQQPGEGRLADEAEGDAGQRDAE